MGKQRKRLRVLRAEHDLTQVKVARMAGLREARYWQIEHAQGAQPREEEKARIAAAFGVRVSDIAWPVPWMPTVVPESRERSA